MAYRKLGRTSAHRKSMLRNLTTDLIVNGRIVTTETRAKEVRKTAEKMITLGKKGDLASRRQAARHIFDKETDKYINLETGELYDALPEGEKHPKQTVLRQLFTVIGKKYATRNGGYTRIFRLTPRRGDASEMALIQLT